MNILKQKTIGLGGVQKSVCIHKNPRSLGLVFVWHSVLIFKKIF